MVNGKVTPEIMDFLEQNYKLSSGKLTPMVEEKFGIRISKRALDNHLTEIRADKSRIENAKMEAVRAAVIESGEKYANKYIQYIDEEIEKLHAMIAESGDIKIETARDRLAASQAMHKLCTMIIDFVKPQPKYDTVINLNWGDVKEITDDEEAAAQTEN